MKYAELAAINVNDHVEKKQNLSYLSWAWAVDTLLRHDNDANWEYQPPTVFPDGTVMVYCTVTAFGRRRTAQLPVMDYKNKAIPQPDAFQVNVTMQRCLAKAIALHGLGLYIYAGEDLPTEFKQETVDKSEGEKVEAVKQVEKPDMSLPKETPKQIEPPEMDSESKVVDWIVSFVDEWIMGIDDVDGLRDFWKVNKSVLSRVEKFSKPQYKAMEDNFKARAAKLKEQK